MSVLKLTYFWEEVHPPLHSLLCFVISYTSHNEEQNTIRDQASRYHLIICLVKLRIILDENVDNKQKLT